MISRAQLEPRDSVVTWGVPGRNLTCSPRRLIPFYCQILKGIRASKMFIISGIFSPNKDHSLWSELIQGQAILYRPGFQRNATRKTDPSPNKPHFFLTQQVITTPRPEAVQTQKRCGLLLAQGHGSQPIPRQRLCQALRVEVPALPLQAHARQGCAPALAGGRSPTVESSSSASPQWWRNLHPRSGFLWGRSTRLSPVNQNFQCG